MQNNNSKYLYVIIGILATLVAILFVINFTDNNTEKEVNNSNNLTSIGATRIYEDSYQDPETGLSFAYAPGTSIKKISASGGFVFELRKGNVYNSVTFYLDTPPHFNSSCFEMDSPVNIQNNTFYVCDVEANEGVVRTYWQKRSNDTNMISVFGEMPSKENSLLVDLGSIVVVQ